MRKVFLYSAAFALSLSAICRAEPHFYAWAPTPTMGWNSWDCFGTTVTEAQTRAQIDVMADQLKAYGWQYVIVDIQWYEPKAVGFGYRKNAALTMDDMGRLLPAENRFPSAAQGVGFKALAKYAHDKGLKFGLHIMRGIPRQAVAENTVVMGTSVFAADIADTNSICKWNGDMYGVNMSRQGAQEYYDSVYQLMASWDIDFVKVDDLSWPYHKAEIEGIRKAIDKCGRPIVFSTSPGETPLAEGAHIVQNANMWRISNDFWDTWKALREQFKRLHDWTPYRGAGHFPDADMLPIGAIRQVGATQPRYTRFTQDEQITLMTLWAIARSPLFMGGDLAKLDDFTRSLLTNAEMIAVNQSSTANRQLFDNGGLIGWIADVPGATAKYLALFNTTDAKAEVGVDLGQLGFKGPVQLRDLWKKSDLPGPKSGRFAPELPAHGAALYRVSAQ